MADNKIYDYVIVGAGSAGCVLATRLSEDPKKTVLLLEAGGSDKSIFIQMPTALSIPMNSPKYNWGYHSEPEKHLGGRSMHCPRGKVLGGSSSINGMAYVRGNAMDYENWADIGATGWAYKDVLPYFKKAETSIRGGDTYRGDNGPLGTTTGRLKNPLYQAFIDAGIAAGFGYSEDTQGFRQDGVALMDMTVRDGVRASAANAYLKPVLARPNLTLLSQVSVSKINFDGKRATGVTYKKLGQTSRVNAGCEVIISAGPIASPQLLMTSGIGDGAALSDLGITVVQDQKAVGKNLQDHLEFYFQHACTQPISLYSSLNPIAKLLIGMRWLLTHKGLGATNHFESGGFIKSRPDVAWPDLQYHFLPVAMSYDGNAVAGGHGFQAHIGPMRSKSRGQVSLKTADMDDHPKIQFNYMSHEDDWAEMRAGLRLTRKLFSQSAFDPYRGRELSPGQDITSDEDIDAFISGAVESAYHPCGTCRMGAPHNSVVDPSLRVYGVEGLRVVDSSIMPQITTGNLNAPTIMLAEKASDIIKGQPPLAALDTPFYQSRGR